MNTDNQYNAEKDLFAEPTLSSMISETFATQIVIDPNVSCN